MNRREVLRFGLAAGLLPLLRATPSVAQVAIYSHDKLKEFWADWFELSKTFDKSSDLHNVGTVFMQAMSARFGSIPVAFIRHDGVRVTFLGVTVRQHTAYAEFESDEAIQRLWPDGTLDETTEYDFPIFIGEPV